MSENHTNPSNEKPAKVVKGLSKQTKALLIAIPAVIIITVVATVLILNMLKEDPVAEVPRGVQLITEANFTEIKEGIQEKVKKGMFQTYMNTTWRFPDGKSASTNCVMGNSSANSYPFYFTLALSDTSEIVYTSGLLPVGTQIEDLILEKELSQGIYPAVVTIHMVDDLGEPVEGNTGFNITLEIEQ